MAEVATSIGGHRIERLGHAGRRLPAMLGSRVVEQVVLGGASVLLAARLDLDQFAAVSALFVVNSAAVTLSDYGVGLAALRCAPGEHVATRALTRMRLANAAVLVVGLVVGILLGGTVGTIVAASAVLWGASAEAFVRKAAAIAGGFGHDTAVAELFGSAAFAIPVVALATGSEALVVVGVALVLKHVVELLTVRRGRELFAPDGTARGIGSLWWTQVVGYGLGNVDYVVVGVVLGADAFAIYTLAYRVAVAIPSIVAWVANRTAIADFSAAPTTVGRQDRYLDYVRPLFVIGAVSAVVAAGAGFVLADLLGSPWQSLGVVVAILAIAAPWRMIAGQAAAVAMAAGAERRLVRWEVTRLGVFAVAFTAAAVAGFDVFLATVTAGWIIGVTVLHELAARRAGLRSWRVLVPCALVATVAAVVVAVSSGVTP